MSNPLQVKAAGITFENPFILASAPPTAKVESIRKAFALGWGGAVLKTITPDSFVVQDVSPRFGGIYAGDVIGFENIELLSHKPVDYWIEATKALKAEFPTKVIIASIMAPVVKEEWQELAKRMQQAPIDAFELNFSCPHGMPEKGIGMAIGTDGELSQKIAGWVKEVAKVPVFVKLSPNVTNIPNIVKQVEKSGVDGFSAINTVQCLIGVDVDTLEPQPNVNGASTFGGYSGRAVKPIGLRVAAQIKTASDLPLLAIGGVSGWKDAIEYIALGADVVQVCTEVMLNGYKVIRQMKAGIENYMKNNGYQSLEDIRGKALQKLTSHELLSKTDRVYARIDDAKCQRCQKCVEICAESAFDAISSDGKDVPCISREKCDGCSLCMFACPYKAIHMEK